MSELLALKPDEIAALVLRLDDYRETNQINPVFTIPLSEKMYLIKCENENGLVFSISSTGAVEYGPGFTEEDKKAAVEQFAAWLADSIRNWQEGQPDLFSSALKGQGNEK